MSSISSNGCNMSCSNPLKSWGYHLMLDCTDCDRVAIKSEAHIRLFFDKLLKVADMKKLGEPKFENLQEGEDTHLFGISAVQLINTSSITCHFADNTGEVYFDLFSCKTFDPHAIIACFREFFSPATVHPTYLIRDATYGIKN